MRDQQKHMLPRCFDRSGGKRKRWTAQYYDDLLDIEPADVVVSEKCVDTTGVSLAAFAVVGVSSRSDQSQGSSAVAERCRRW